MVSSSRRLPVRSVRAHRVAREEVPRRRRLDAVRPRAEVHGVEVLDEDLLLGELLVQPERVLDLLDLAVHVALRREQAVLHELLGDGRTTLLDLPRRHVGEERAEHRAEVDAVVGPERTVLGGDHRVRHPFGYLVERVDRIPGLQAEGPHRVRAVGPVDGRGLRQLLEVADLLGRVVMADGDLDRAGDQGGDARAHDESADHDRHQERQTESPPSIHLLAPPGERRYALFRTSPVTPARFPRPRRLDARLA